MKTKILILTLLVCVLLCGCMKKSENNDNQPDGVNADVVDNEALEEPEVPEISVPKEPEEPFSQEPQVPEISVPEEPDVPVSAEPDVTEQPQEPEKVRVTGITLTTYDVTVNIGRKFMPIVTMYPKDAPDKREIWTSSDESIATVDYLGNIKGVKDGNCTVTVTSVDNPEVFAKVNVTVLPLPECTYIDGILIANKTYALPRDYNPGVDREAMAQLEAMFAGAKKDGLSLWIASGYRSYDYQKMLYDNYCAKDGKAAADRYSARPGHSEHQTGLAFDINNASSSFENTPEALWLAENCYKYGFIIRYPEGKESITGYKYEPWHVRYLGIEKATEVFNSGKTLEEFLGITSVYSY